MFLDSLKKREIKSLKKKKNELIESYNEKIENNKKKTVKTKKNMADEIKEDINDTTFLEKNILGINKEYDSKLYDQKIKKLESFILEEYLKYYLKNEENQKKIKNKDDEIMEIDIEFGKDVEKEMKNEELSDEEETKVELNEENQDIIDKIFELKKIGKEKKFTYILNSKWKKNKRKNKKTK